jgi:hypothetical protein
MTLNSSWEGARRETPLSLDGNRIGLQAIGLDHGGREADWLGGGWSTLALNIRSNMK